MSGHSAESGALRVRLHAAHAVPINPTPEGCPLCPEYLAVLATAWDEGYQTCLGDFDIAARREARSPNPYRPISPAGGDA